MKKKPILIVIIVLVLLGIAGYVAKTKLSSIVNKTLLSKGSNVVSKALDKTAAGGIKGSIEELILMGKSLSCSYTQDLDDTKVESSTFISGDKFRVDSKVDSGEEIGMVDFHMISDGTYAYMWGDKETKGMKINLKEMEEMNKDNPDATQAQAFNIREAMKGYDYDCKPWIVDQSKFSVPTDVEFADLSEMMKGFQDQAKELCKFCDDMETAEEIAECKSNLKCE